MSGVSIISSPDVSCEPSDDRMIGLSGKGEVCVSGFDLTRDRGSGKSGSGEGVTDPGRSRSKGSVG